MDTGGRRPGLCRVLAVDDDPQVLGLLTRVLTRDGFDVTALATASEALDAIRRNPPDIVLLDVNLS